MSEANLVGIAFLVILLIAVYAGPILYYLEENEIL